MPERSLYDCSHPEFLFCRPREEAMALYQEALGARVGCLLRYEDADKADWPRPLIPEQEKYIYHAELFFGGHRIMMCDNLDVPFKKSTALSLTVTFDTKEEVRRAYGIMREGSETIYPVHSTTYNSCVVVFIDRFGFRWGFMTEQTER